MSWKLWKDKGARATEEFKKGESLFFQQKWNDAGTNYDRASNLARDSGDESTALLANALARLCNAISLKSDPSSWETAAIAFFQVTEPVVNVPNPVESEKVSIQCGLYGEFLQLENDNDISETKAVSYEELAKKYLILGTDPLFYPIILYDTQESGFEVGNYLAGKSEELRGILSESSDPKKAAEHYSSAFTRYNLSNRQSNSQHVNSKLDAAQTEGKCWFCGKEGFGWNINFLGMRSQVTPYLQGLSSESLFKEFRSSEEIIVCTSCFSAINWEADRVARKYYDLVQSRLDALTDIANDLVSAVNRLQEYSHTH